MLSDKRNSRARDLISLLTNVALSQDVPFHQPQQLQCLHHSASYLCAPILSTQPSTGEDLYLARNGFSVRHKYCTDTFHSYNVIVQHC